MEDGEIIFRVKMPGGAVESRVFPNIKAFQDEMLEEGKRWQGFPMQGQNHLWNPEASLSNFKQEINKHSDSVINIINAIEKYYSAVNIADINTLYYPSWTMLGRSLLNHKQQKDFFVGLEKGFWENQHELYSSFSLPWLGGLILAHSLRNGLSASSPENMLNEMHAIRDMHAKIIKEAVESKARMEKLYNDDLRLKAAVTYWGDKAKDHATKKSFWMWSVVGWSILSLGALAAYLKYGSRYFTETIKIFGEEPWAYVCGFLILASFVYWVIRFVVSQYNQHNHLYTDAKERETMVLTFLALVNEENAKGSVTEKDHLGLVLAALFRPSAIGGCENGPVPFYEIVANVLNKKGS